MKDNDKISTQIIINQKMILNMENFTILFQQIKFN